MNCPKKMLTYQIRFIKRSRDRYYNINMKKAVKWAFLNFIYCFNWNICYKVA